MAKDENKSIQSALQGLSSGVASATGRGVRAKIYFQEGEDPNLPPGVPLFDDSPYEEVLSKANSFIVLGKDRPSGKESGRSLESHAHSIDIVVGRKGKNVEVVQPQFKEDAARIFISEKTDIDDPLYFDLRDNRKDGGVGNVTSKSAIGMKADSIRIIGREGIKIVTGSDLINSKDAPIEGIAGIDLCAGNYRGAEMQPLVKGNNMVDCVDRLLKYIEQLQNMVMDFVNYQMDINSKQSNINSSLQTHQHPPIPPIVGGPVLPSPALLTGVPTAQAGIAGATVGLATKASGLPNEAANASGTRNKYLNRNGEKYICSDYNKSN